MSNQKPNEFDSEKFNSNTKKSYKKLDSNNQNFTLNTLPSRDKTFSSFIITPVKSPVSPITPLSQFNNSNLKDNQGNTPLVNQISNKASNEKPNKFQFKNNSNHIKSHSNSTNKLGNKFDKLQEDINDVLNTSENDNDNIDYNNNKDNKNNKDDSGYINYRDTPNYYKVNDRRNDQSFNEEVNNSVVNTNFSYEYKASLNKLSSELNKFPYQQIQQEKKSLFSSINIYYKYSKLIIIKYI